VFGYLMFIDSDVSKPSPCLQKVYLISMLEGVKQSI